MGEVIAGLVVFGVLLTVGVELVTRASTARAKHEIADTFEDVARTYLAEARLDDCAHHLGTIDIAVPGDPYAPPDWGEPDDTSDVGPCGLPIGSHMPATNNGRDCTDAEKDDRPPNAVRFCLDYDRHQGAVVDVVDAYQPPIWCTEGNMLDDALSGSDPVAARRCVPMPTRTVTVTHPGGQGSITRATTGRLQNRTDPVWVKVNAASQDTITLQITIDSVRKMKLPVVDGSTYWVDDAEWQDVTDGKCGIEGFDHALSVDILAADDQLAKEASC